MLGGLTGSLGHLAGATLVGMLPGGDDADVVAVGQLDAFELVPLCRGRRAHVRLAFVDPEVQQPIGLVDPGALGLYLRHSIEDAGRAYSVDDSAGAAAIEDAKLLLSRRRLAR